MIYCCERCERGRLQRACDNLREAISDYLYHVITTASDTVLNQMWRKWESQNEAKAKTLAQEETRPDRAE